MPPHAHDAHGGLGQSQAQRQFHMDTRTTPQVETVAYPRGTPGRQPPSHPYNHHRPNAPNLTYPHKGRVHEPDLYCAPSSTTSARGREPGNSRPTQCLPLSTPTGPRHVRNQQRYANATPQDWASHNNNIGHQNDKNYRAPLSRRERDHFRHQSHGPMPIPAPHDQPTGTSIIPSAPRATQNKDAGTSYLNKTNLTKSCHIGILPSSEPEAQSAKDVSIDTRNHVPVELGGGGGAEGDTPSAAMTNTTRGDSVTTPQAVPQFSATSWPNVATQYGKNGQSVLPARMTKTIEPPPLSTWDHQVQPFQNNAMPIPSLSHDQPTSTSIVPSAPIAARAAQNEDAGKSSLDEINVEKSSHIGILPSSEPETPSAKDVSIDTQNHLPVRGEGDTPSAAMTDSTCGELSASATAVSTPYTAMRYDVPAGPGGGDTPSATTTNPTRGDLPASVTAVQPLPTPYTAMQYNVSAGLDGDTQPAAMTNPTRGDLPASVTPPQAAPRCSSTSWPAAATQRGKDGQPSKRPLASLNLKFRKRKLTPNSEEGSISPSLKIDLEKKGDDDTCGGAQIKSSEREWGPVFPDTWIPTPPSSSRSFWDTVMGPTAVTAVIAQQPVEPKFAGPTQIEATSFVQPPPQPALKRKKNQASVGETAGDDEKKVKKARKKKNEGKKNEGVEVKIEAGVIEVPAAIVHPAAGGEEPPRKKKRKADREVGAVSEGGKVRLGGQDIAGLSEGAETSATVGIVGDDGREVTRGGDDDEPVGSAVKKKKKKIKLADEAVDGGEGTMDNSVPIISGSTTAAITGEWAKKRTKVSNNDKLSSKDVKWTVSACPDAKPRSSRAKSKRPPNSALNGSATGGTAPERILRPNIWAAVRFFFLDSFVPREK